MKTRIFDWLGMTASSLCMVHCILSSALLIFAPLYLSPFFSNEAIHPVFLAFASLFALFALTDGYRKHRKLSVVLFGLIGLTLLFVALFFEHTIYEPIITAIGGLSLIMAHFKNWQNCPDGGACAVPH